MRKGGVMDDCYKCKHKIDVPGHCHIKCANPDRKMTGNAHGIKNGWFIYPFLFDPIWKTKKCDNYESIRPVVSPTVSPEN
jgi:hypothetical protein